MKNIRLVPEDRCTGCGACYNKCPFGAISMEYNDEGFMSPVLDEVKCTSCGLCTNVCAALNKPLANPEPTSAYALITDDGIRESSSSGGFFTLIARHILSLGGHIFGAAYDAGYKTVSHIEISSEDDLYRLRGSKYVQSNTHDTYKRAAKLLSDGKYVLYSGTPCQVAGLKAYLKRDWEKLYLVDIICHGVPSPKAYEAYLTEKAEGKPILKMDFREKAHFGWGTAFSLFTEDGVYRNDCFNDPYLKGFLGGMITRQICTDCAYTSTGRQGDFTLGDFWGIEGVCPEYSDKRGTSLVMVNTDKAKALFEKVASGAVRYTKVPIGKVKEVAATRNGRLLCPTRRHALRGKFFAEFKKNGMTSYTEAYAATNKKYDVGYVGWWDSDNFGSALTSFAMTRVLRSLGKSVLLLEHPGLTPEEVKTSRGYAFAKRHSDTTEISRYKNNAEFNQLCDTFLVGSDQLWNWWNNKHATGYFFLDFAYKDHKKIAYATSFGCDFTDYPEDIRLKVGYYLSRFDAISVRERSGVDVLKREFMTDATHVLDPVFLCDMDSYREVVNAGIKVDEPYVFSYILDPTEDKINMVKETARARGISYRIAIDALGNVNDESKKLIDGTLASDPNVLRDIGIEDWLSLIAGADYVATDSFHGFCFSLIFEKPSMAYVNPRRGAARFESIAQQLGVEDRLIVSFAEAEERGLATRDIDYSAVREKLEANRCQSRKWLADALEAKNRRIGVKELLMWKCLEHDGKINDAAKARDEAQARVAELEQRLKALEERMDRGFFARLFGRGK